MANYPWASSNAFEYPKPCCECPPDCEFLIPGSPFTTLEEAEAGLDNVLSCRCYFYPSLFATLPTTRSFSYDSDSFSANYSYEAETESSAGAEVALTAYLPAGTITFNISGGVTCASLVTISTSTSISLFGPDGEHTSTDASGEFTITEAGCYFISISYSGECGCPPFPEECPPGITVSLSATVTMTGMVLAPAVAPYGGNVLYCE